MIIVLAPLQNTAENSQGYGPREGEGGTPDRLSLHSPVSQPSKSGVSLCHSQQIYRDQGK